ncbi:putative Permease, YjgP/YjgQ family [Nitrospira sp. KM1]|uniref:LPS export ABC transporter permease LptF n=1 Tax=Nitrospira sp. KM1 TaxID=1936990 RepID=UPI0013A78A53|nr:LPS export ABC transporter permease LptF [Nitrospira sp. KM1]BCA53624.1 putative Permease, YjgP/YjgQ family [Nitrospira sp. KM1]
MFLRKLLDRYIFTELLSPFLVSLGVLCFVMLTRELLRLVELLVSKGVGIFAVLKVFANLLPSFLVLTLPIAGIIASITAFGRLSFDKELVAMRAAGLSLLRLSQPVFLFAALVFTLTLWLAQWGQPWSSTNLKKVALNLLRDQLVLALERGTFNEPIPKMMIFVSDLGDDPRSTGIFVSDERNADDPRIIVARQYEVLVEPSTNQIALRLLDGVIHSKPDELDEYQQVGFSNYDLKLSLSQSGYTSTEERPSYESIMRQLADSQGKDPAALRRLMEYYKDLAFPTASLVFCILGVPVGIVSKRSGRIGGFAVGVLVVILYYVLNVACEFLVTTAVIPPFAGAWLPNIIFAVITVLWFYKISRE